MQLDTGVIIVGAHHIQAVAVSLMQRYSPHLLTIFPAEMTLLYPFVPMDELESACHTLQNIGADLAPFEITMQGYGQFPLTTYMAPADPSPILAVIRLLMAAFPDYPPYGGRFGDDLRPHMTVAQFDDVEEQQQAVLPDYGSLSFKVDRLHVVHGPSTMDGPWLTYDVVRLTGS